MACRILPVSPSPEKTMNNFYLKYKSPIAAILVIILLAGAYSMTSMKSGLFPDITFPKIKIIAENGEQPVDKMMVTVTIPLENAIKRVEDLMMIRNTTSRGTCEISAFLNWGTDVDLGKQRIEAQINAIKQTLPPDVSITIEKMNPSILLVMGFSLEGDSRSLVELRQLAEYTIKPIISRIEGVSEVAVIGGKVKEYHVILDPAKMSNLRLTPAAIAEVLSHSNFIESDGYAVEYNRMYLTLTDAAIDGKNDLENTIIVNSAKSLVHLKDIARIEIANRREYIKINANGKDVPLIAIMKQPKANLLDVCSAVQAQLKEVNSVLPKGVALRPFYSQADFVGDSIGSLRDVMWIGLILAILVSVLFLRSLKASSVILITIPITLSLTLVALHTLGYTFNIMTIGAIAAAIGLIIDDAIVVVEQIHRTHEEHPEEESSQLVREAIRFLLPAMVGSSLSTIVIFLPFILMSGVAGAYFKVMTDTMIITLICSFFVTWLGLPVIYILLAGKGHSIKQKSKEVKQRGWVYFVIRRAGISGTVILFLIAATVYIMPRLASGFLPEMDEGAIVLDYKSPAGSSLEATDKMLRTVDRILQETPEVESFSRRTGTQMGFFITEPNDGDYLIQLHKERSRTTEEVSDDIRGRIEAVLPALQIDFGQVIGDMLGDLMESVQPIEVKIFGDDHKRLVALANRVAALIEETPGTADVYNGILVAGPEIKLEPKTARLAQYQLTPEDFHFQMQTKLEGSVAGAILEKNRMVDIRIFEEPRVQSISKLKHGYIFLNDGRLKPVDEFADWIITAGVAEIDRENLKPMAAVTARLNNRDLGSTLREVRRRVQADIKLPPGYQIVYGGAYAQQQMAFRELMMILLGAVLLVFTVILFLFRSIKVSLAIIFIAVLGMAGSLLALFITGTPLNVGSYTGIIMIVGIIGENAIFTYLQYLQARKTGQAVDESLVYTISTRLRPKLMTALGAIAALFPLALGLGTGAQMHQPLAIAIIGGLIAAMPLLLMVLPTLLRILDKE
jgi:heavy metal efflux system protein